MKRLAIGISLLLSPMAFGKSHQESFRNVNFSLERQFTYQANHQQVFARYHGEGNKEDFEFIVREFNLAFDKIIRDANLDETTQCHNYSLSIYDLREGTINNRNIMAFFNWRPVQAGRYKLSGLYDSLYAGPNSATIFVSLDTSSRRETIIHETAHFIYDSYCLSGMEMNTEEFAQHYEEIL